MTVNANDLPSTTSAAYRAAKPIVDLLYDTASGTARMHERATAYIPKWEKERPKTHRQRATSISFYGGLARTLTAATGMLFAKPLSRSDNWTPELARDWDNLDLAGTLGDVLAKRIAERALLYGYECVLVDQPSRPEGAESNPAADRALNLRPYWARYARADVLSVRFSRINNALKPTQVVLRESLTEPSGRFGDAARTVYLVPALVRVDGAIVARWERIEEVMEAGTVTGVRVIDAGVYLDARGEPFDELPLAFVQAGRTGDGGVLDVIPPLLDVAWANLDHWRISTDLRWYERLCAYPQPHVSGRLVRGSDEAGAPTLALGPDTGVHTEENGTFAFVELQGSSLTQLRQSREDAKRNMAELGLSFLDRKVGGVETAEAKRLDAAAEQASLATAAQCIEDGLNELLRLHARYYGVESERAPTVTVNRDFSAQTLDAPTMSAYAAAVRDAGLPVRVLLEEWQRGGRLPATADLDAIERDMLASAVSPEEAFA